MKIIIIDNKDQIDDFLKAQNIPSGSFLQSYLWGEFQKQYGFKIWRLGVFEQNKLLAVFLIIKHPLPLGKSYLYCPKGPVLAMKKWELEKAKEVFKLILEKVKEISIQEKAIFFRIEPPTTSDQFKELKDFFYLRETSAIQPPVNWMLDLKKTEEEILSNMKQKTRYNIRLAQKKNVQIRTSNNINEIDQFFSLVQETAKRNQIRTHPKRYYLKMIEFFIPINLIKLYIAEHNKKILAMNLILFYGKTATYLHGGSSSNYRNLMAPYLLHWQAIKEAKKTGIEYYDFGGVSPEDQPNHKWAGISRFKRGFSGYQIKTVGTFDKVLNPAWYYLYKTAKRIRPN